MRELPTRLMRFDTAVRHDPAIDDWFDLQSPQLSVIARRWFDYMRRRGDDVCELLHDGHPTACVGNAAFCYVDAFTAHVNVGFYLGAWLDDPAGMLQGTGKRMRHVKLRPGEDADTRALEALVESAYVDLRAHLRARRR